MRLLALLIVISFITACGSSGRYAMRHDAAPLRAPNADELKDPVVTSEKKSVSASRSYTIKGKTYTPLHNEQDFAQVGVASWYGRKFHGYDTSNGETYDMFAMTAAHKTLPLPSFVKVTNLDNGKTAIVRVNDRGPFHDNRIIDLSYAAAYKLGYHQQGTARVKIEALTPEVNKHHAYIQIAATKSLENLTVLAKKLTHEYQVNSKIIKKDGIYRLRLGPIDNAQYAKDLLVQIKTNDHHNAFLLYSD
jgi:rare lipoprotein A